MRECLVDGAIFDVGHLYWDHVLTVQTVEGWRWQKDIEQPRRCVRFIAHKSSHVQKITWSGWVRGILSEAVDYRVGTALAKLPLSLTPRQCTVTKRESHGGCCDLQRCHLAPGRWGRAPANTPAEEDRRDLRSLERRQASVPGISACLFTLQAARACVSAMMSGGGRKRRNEWKGKEAKLQPRRPSLS